MLNTFQPSSHPIIKHLWSFDCSPMFVHHPTLDIWWADGWFSDLCGDPTQTGNGVSAMAERGGDYLNHNKSVRSSFQSFWGSFSHAWKNSKSESLWQSHYVDKERKWGNKWGNMMSVVRRVEDGDRSPLMLWEDYERLDTERQIWAHKFTSSGITPPPKALLL